MAKDYNFCVLHDSLLLDNIVMGNNNEEGCQCLLEKVPLILADVVIATSRSSEMAMKNMQSFEDNEERSMSKMSIINPVLLV